MPLRQRTTPLHHHPRHSMDPDCFERGDTVRVVNMPHVIFVFISSTDNGYSRLMMQLPVSTTEQNYVTTLFVRVQSSNVVLPESMAMRDRQAIEDQHLSPTLDCAPVKKKFTRGIEIVDGRKEYRWTISSRKYLPTLLKDFGSGMTSPAEEIVACACCVF